jgi:hypothetical protein
VGEVLKRVPGWTWIALTAAGLAIAYGVGFAGYVGYDQLWGLIWGDDIAHLRTPQMEGM